MTARSGVYLGALTAYSYAPLQRAGTYLNDLPSFSIYPKSRLSSWAYTQPTGYSPADLQPGRIEVIPAFVSTALTINVAIRDAATGQPLTGATLAVLLKKSGATSFSSISPTVTETGGGTYDVALTGSHLDTKGIAVIRVTANASVVGQPNGLPRNDIYVNVQAINLYDVALGRFPTGTVVSNAGNSATSFATSRTESTADYWKLAFLVFTSGALAGQVKQITGFTVLNGVMSFTSPGFTATPSAGDAFYIVNS